MTRSSDEIVDGCSAGCAGTSSSGAGSLCPKPNCHGFGVPLATFLSSAHVLLSGNSSPINWQTRMPILTPATSARPPCDKPRALDLKWRTGGQTRWSALPRATPTRDRHSSTIGRTFVEPSDHEAVVAREAGGTLRYIDDDHHSACLDPPRGRPVATMTPRPSLSLTGGLAAAPRPAATVLGPPSSELDQVDVWTTLDSAACCIYCILSYCTSVPE